MNHWWVNGQPQTRIEITDRGFSYADGLFETIAIRGARLRFLDHHLDRLLDGCKRLGIEPRMTRDHLSAELAAAAATLVCGVLKLIVTRGAGPRGYAVSPAAIPTIVWGIAATSPMRSDPIRLRWCETMVSVNRATAGLKTLGRLEQVLARREWTDPAVTEGLMTNSQGWLIGGTASNVFLVAGNQLLTPALHHSGVSGVMRRVVLAAAQGAGIRVTAADIRPALVNEATEVFVTNALIGIRPVARLENKVWMPGPITGRLRQLLADIGVDECSAGD